MGSFDYLLKRSPHDNTDNTDNTQEADQPNLGPGNPDSAGIGSIGSIVSIVRRPLPPKFKEPATATESPADVPQGWLEGVSRLRGMTSPETVAPDSWAAFLGSCESFMASPWPGKAASMGWDAYDLFGCHNLKPVARVDRMGLLWLLRGGGVIALTSEAAVIEMPSGSRLTYRTNPIRDPGDVLAWELG